jgi:hypothetical protein
LWFDDDVEVAVYVDLEDLDGLEHSSFWQCGQAIARRRSVCPLAALLQKLDTRKRQQPSRLPN